MLLIVVLLNVCIVFASIVTYLSSKNRNLGSFFTGMGFGTALLGVVFGAIKFFN